MSMPLSDVPADGDGGDAFHRAPKADRQFVEVRPMLPIEVVNVIDAECMVLASQGQPIDRTALIKRILGEWAVQRHRAASVVLRVAGANPISLDSE